MLGALLGVAIATLAIGAAVYVGTSGNNGAPDGWSKWKPSSDDGVDAARQIATHVGRHYRLSDGNQIVGVQASKLEVFDVPLEVALRTAPQGGNIDFIDGNGLMFTLNGLGPKGSVRGGKPSEARHLLLRREALELALYTFRYVKDVDLVVALLPPKPPEKKNKDGTTSTGRRRRRRRRFLPPRRPRAAARDPAARHDPGHDAAAGDAPARRVAPDRRAHAQQPVPRLLPAGAGPEGVPRAGPPARVAQVDVLERAGEVEARLVAALDGVDRGSRVDDAAEPVARRAHAGQAAPAVAPRVVDLGGADRARALLAAEHGDPAADGGGGDPAARLPHVAHAHPAARFGS